MRSINTSSEEACGRVARAREGGAAGVVCSARAVPAIPLDFVNLVVPRAVSCWTIVILKPTVGMPTAVRCDGSHKTALPARMGWPFRWAKWLLDRYAPDGTRASGHSGGWDTPAERCPRPPVARRFEHLAKKAGSVSPRRHLPRASRCAGCGTAIFGDALPLKTFCRRRCER